MRSPCVVGVLRGVQYQLPNVLPGGTLCCTLRRAVQAAGLEALLSDTTTNLTLFAPIDAAWVEAATRLQLADPTGVLSLGRCARLAN